MPRVEVPVTDNAPVAATLATNPADSDADLVFTARAGGQWGNDVQIAFIDPGSPSAAASVVVEGFLITVNLATSALSAIITTAARVMTLIDSSQDARKLVSVALGVGADGTGIVDAFAAAALTGGVYGVAQVAVTNGDATNDHYLRGNDGRVVLQVVSSDAGAQTVTILRSASLDPGVPLEDEVVSIPAGATWDLGPFPADEFNQNALGDLYFNPSVSNTLDFRAKRVNRAT
jgi:hypothetical protein